MENKRIVLLAGACESTNIVFNSLDKNFGVESVLLEERENIVIFLRRRIKRLGVFTVLGQILFQMFISKPLSFLSKKRSKEIIDKNQLNVSEIPKEKTRFVSSVNSDDTIKLLQDLKPDIVIVNGTRIISKKVLSCIDCKFINTHAGITPKYRGVHGTYWALVNDDILNSGVTVHFVDSGIDTGNIIYQANVIPTKEDNFTTYPLLQISEGIKLLNSAIEDFLTEKLVTINKKTTESKLWYHPTIWMYIYYRIVKKVK